MRSILTAILTTIIINVSAQAPLSPSNHAFEKKWLQNQRYDMKWFALRDTNRMEIGEVTTKISADDLTVTVVTTVNMRGSKTSWVDSTVARKTDLSPIRHSSYNQQRDIVLDFGKVVTGFYKDKLKNTYTQLNDVTKGTYFDSNLYPMLISWLPLKDGLKQEIAIYDYNPSGKIGILKAFVKNTESGSFTTLKSGKIDVWIVSVEDEISSGKTSMTYYISKSDRKIWKQEINSSGRKMEMLRIEN